MRDLQKERRIYREIAAEEAGLSPSAGYGPGSMRIFIPQGMDPATVAAFLGKDIDRTKWRPLQPEPPSPPILRFFVPGLDDEASVEHPPRPGPPPPP